MAVYVAPGTPSGQPNIYIPSRGGALTAGALKGRGLYFARDLLQSGQRSVFRPMGTGVSVEVTLQGFNVAIQHFDAFMALMDAAFPKLMEITGQIVQHNARDRVAIDTGDTYRSIYYEVYNQQDGYAVDIGPTTFYSPWLEFGTAVTRPQPFMIPAGEMIAEDFKSATAQVVKLAVEGASAPRMSGKYSDLEQVLGHYRQYLYSTAKALGDISIIGARHLISPIRSELYSLARSLGDIQSVVGGYVGHRISRRLAGRITGKFIGGVGASFSGGGNYSSFVGGAAGHRIYQRVVGRYAGQRIIGGF